MPGLFGTVKVEIYEAGAEYYVPKGSKGEGS
jgi:hypothetical protein